MTRWNQWKDHNDKSLFQFNNKSIMLITHENTPDSCMESDLKHT